MPTSLQCDGLRYDIMRLQEYPTGRLTSYFLHNHFCLVVFLAEVGGVAAFALLEQTVEVAEGVEPAVVADLGDGSGGVDEQTGGMA